MNIFNKITLQKLKKNKTGTFITIIGIILSISMITAVTTSISTLRNDLIQDVVVRIGGWHGVIDGLSKKEQDSLQTNDQVNKVVSIQNLGFAKLANSKADNKPYLFIGAVGNNLTDLVPVAVTQGRMPQNSHEIILPEHLRITGGIPYSIGDVLTLEIGDRVRDDRFLDQDYSYIVEGPSLMPWEKEELIKRETRTYTVVGICSRPSFEPYGAPGFTALTISDGTGADSYDSYFTLHKISNTFAFMKDNFNSHGSSVNDDYLKYYGVPEVSTNLALLYGLAGVLILIIMFGSILLIHNSFSISIKERVKQFGLLKSIGATKRQILQSVLFEALCLCSIGIPIGVLGGIAGIGATLALSKNLFISLIRRDPAAVFTLHVSWAAVLVATLAGLVTVLVSAYIPAKKAVRIPAVESIRQTNDIHIRAKKVKTSKLTYRLFGLEGMIASKNFKHGREKYRAAIVSLFLSVVLFVSASSYCDYLASSMRKAADQSEYDISYSNISDETAKYPIDKLFADLSSVSGVTESEYCSAVSGFELSVPLINLSKDYIDYLNQYFDGDYLGSLQSKEPRISITLAFVDDVTYSRILEENQLDASIYGNMESPKALVYDFTKFYDRNEEKHYAFHVLNGRFESGKLISSPRTDLNTYIYEKGQGKSITMSPDKPTVLAALQIGAYIEKVPFSVGTGNNIGGTALIYPWSAMPAICGKEKVLENLSNWAAFYFKAPSHKAVYESMSIVLQEKNLPVSTLYDTAEAAESDRALATIITIFSYGFIILISLIAVANVFNTISTNLGLRRREFAMLQSAGMTKRGFNRMMNFECILYGIKGLLYGIPVAVGVTFLVYRSMLDKLQTAFYIPWYSIVISIGSVFAVVFATMLYSMSKIKKDNPVDALKNENL